VVPMLESWHPFLVPAIPFLGAAITGLFGKQLGKKASAMIACAAPMAAFALVLSVFAQLLLAGDNFSGLETNLGTWIAIGEGTSSSFRANFLFRLDKLSVYMALVITGVGSLIHIYSAGYMEHERPGRFARYFSHLNMFMGMMLVLVTGSDLLLLFVGWEGVGLCSYLLIGFEYEEDWKANAGMKAFLVNRVGDLGFLLGMFILVTQLITPGAGSATLSFANINALGVANLGADQAFWVGIAALCLFIGATGKSAQIPLFIWLPDAMAGPTPVSALIHAATMVTAGVYMIARLGSFFSVAAVGGIPILSIIALIGAFTAFVAATAATVQTDIKKVLAYSTVSQLGFMFMGLGAGAFGAALFHVMTHAFFKALLFLGAGAVIHAMHGEQNMHRMGGLRKHLPITFMAFVVGGLALAGVPPFAGFFSKDLILFRVYERFFEGGGTSWLVIWGLGLAAALLTSFYTARMISLTFLGRSRLPEEELEKTLHAPGRAMAWPLLVLIGASIIGGWLVLPEVFVEHWDKVNGFLGPVVKAAPSPIEGWNNWKLASMAGKVDEAALHGMGEAFMHAHHSAEWRGILLSVLAALGGGFLGLRMFRERIQVPLEGGTARAMGRDFLFDAWGFDQFYQVCLVEPFVRLSGFLHRWADVAILDRGFVDGAGRLSTWVSEFVLIFQTGLVSRAAFYMALGAIAVLVLLLG